MQSTAFRPSESKSVRTDVELIKAALAGDQRGYEELTLRYQDRLYRSILLEVDCKMLAEDIVQDAFVRAFMNLGAFRSDCHFYTWLYRIALNARHSYYRKRARSLPMTLLDDASYVSTTPTHDSPSRTVERVEECGQVRSALRRLDEAHRAILILREFEGLDYQTIAEVLQVKIGTVRSRLSRAREQLKNELTNYLQTEKKNAATSDSNSVSSEHFQY